MEILAITSYVDRGLIRERIEYRTDEGLVRFADTHCAMTGRLLATSRRRCMWHCYYHGHYCKEADQMLTQLANEQISELAFLSWRFSNTQYPDEQSA